MGLATIALILVLNRTAVRKFSMVLAFAVATVATAVLELSSVAVVGDIAAIPSSLPQFKAPDMSHVPQLVVPAIAIAVIGLVQGAGVSKSVPNPDGAYGNASRDFVAQGAANAVLGFFRGMPIGGSVSASALNVSSGARSRWANVYAGVIVAVVLLLFGNYVEKVPLPTVAALLIVASAAALKPAAFMEVWRTNWAARIIMLLTLALTLAVPLQYAVLAGVVLADHPAHLQFVAGHQGAQTRARRRGPLRGGGAAGTAAGRRGHLIDIYGSVFYADTEAIDAKLPDVDGTKRAVLVVRLRGRGELGSSAIGLLRRWAEQLQEGDGALLLAGVGQKMGDQLERTGIAALLGPAEHLPGTQPRLPVYARRIRGGASAAAARRENVTDIRRKHG